MQLKSDINLPRRQQRRLTIGLVLTFVLVHALLYQPLGVFRNVFAVIVGLLCPAYVLWEILLSTFHLRSIDPHIEKKPSDTQEGGACFVVAVLINLGWFFVSTNISGVGAAVWWKNPTLDINNAVQLSVLLFALALVVQPGVGVRRIDECLDRWVAAFGLVLLANAQALLDSHYHLLPASVTGQPPITRALWIQWWITNLSTFYLYLAGALLVVWGISMRVLVVFIIAFVLLAAVVLHWIFGVI